jgi:hypothetical protein
MGAAVDRWRRHGPVKAENVYGLLEDIRARPQYWSGVLGSLDQLSLLLVGYRAAVENHGAEQDIDFAFGNPGPFSDWLLHRRHPAGSSAMARSIAFAWPLAIDHMATDRNVPAFDLFFELVDEFRAERAAYRFGSQEEQVPDVASAVDVPFAVGASCSGSTPWFSQGEAESRGVYPAVAAIRAEPAWCRAATPEYRAQLGALGILDVDFDADMVVVVEIGRRPSTGYGVELERIVEADGALYVCAVETKWMGASGAAIRYPACWATTPHFDGPIRLVLRRTTAGG